MKLVNENRIYFSSLSVVDEFAGHFLRLRSKQLRAVSVYGSTQKSGQERLNFKYGTKRIP